MKRSTAAVTIMLLLAFGFEFCRRSGERGFFPLDQSIEFDGAYRIMSGQVPYKDFLMPVGPLVFWLQAAVFRMTGVSWGSYVLGAALMNVVATALGILLLQKLFPDRRWISWIGGLLTATWFYPPYGTPNMETTAFAFAFIGIVACVSAVCGRRLSGIGCASLLWLSGVCCVLSFLGKQNAGLLVAPLYLIVPMAAFGNNPRRLAVAAGWIGSGVAAAGALYGVWLMGWSDPTAFYLHVFEIPQQLGRSRILASGMLRNLCGGGDLAFVRVAAMSAEIFAALVAVAAFRARSEPAPSDRRIHVALAICIYLPFFQNAFTGCTRNQWQECMPFVGIILAGALGTALWAVGRTADDPGAERRIRPFDSWFLPFLLVAAGVGCGDLTDSKVPAVAAVGAVLAAWTVGLFKTPLESTGLAGAILTKFPRSAPRLAGIVLAVYVIGRAEQIGIRDSWHRVVHDIFSGAQFPAYSQVPGLDRLKWGIPTEVRGVDTTDADVAELVSYLKREGKAFFVFPDFTMLYALVGTPSPQPLLWFHEGLTYPKQYDAALDHRVVQALEANKVEIVVLQKGAHFGSASQQLATLPLLNAYVEGEFSLVRESGPFEIRRKRSSDLAGHARPYAPAHFR